MFPFLEMLVPGAVICVTCDKHTRKKAPWSFDVAITIATEIMGSSAKRKKEKQKDFQVFSFMLLFHQHIANPRRNPNSRWAKPRPNRRTLQTPVSDPKVPWIPLLRQWSAKLINTSNCPQSTIPPCRRPVLFQSIYPSPLPPHLQIRQSKARLSRPSNLIHRNASCQLATPTTSERNTPDTTSINPRRKQQRAYAAAQAAADTAAQ